MLGFYEVGEKPDTACVEHGASSGDGYARIRYAGKRMKRHRWKAGLFYGWDAIEGKVVSHACDNRACDRIDHLRVGTQYDNMQDMISKGRANKPGRPPATYCINGHAYADDSFIAANGNQRCRICRRATQKRWYDSRKAQGGR